MISFCVFGPDRLYSAGAVANVKLCRRLYPGWVCRCYVGDRVDRVDRQRLLDAGADVVDRIEPGDFSPLFWRFLPVIDPAVEVCLFRDADSRLSAREASAVEQWLVSGRSFHIMRDHPQHWIEILAGMWGCTRPGARQIRALLPDPLWNSQPYVDQWWLRDAVYPVIRSDVFVHDPFGHIPTEDAHDFPTPREPGLFVGQGFTADGQPRVPEHALMM